MSLYSPSSGKHAGVTLGASRSKSARKGNSGAQTVRAKGTESEVRGCVLNVGHCISKRRSMGEIIFRQGEVWLHQTSPVEEVGRETVDHVTWGSARVVD